MANQTFGKFIFGMSDLKVTSIGGSPTQEDLDAAMELTFRPRFRGGTLEGDDADKAVVSFITGGECTVSAGSISDAAIAIITGVAPTLAGISPNQTNTIQIDAAQRMPYFEVAGKALDEGSGDVHIILKKVKLVGGFEISMKDGEYVTNGFELQAVDDGSNGIIQIVQNETAAALPTP